MSNTLSMSDILGAAMGMQGGQAQQSNPMGDILGSIMGGLGGGSSMGGGVQQQQSGGGMGVLGDILGGVLGGGMGGGMQQQAGGGLGNILGSVIGGGASGAMGGSSAAGGILNAMGGPNSSIIHSISDKTGLPPMVIYMAVTFIIGKLMSDAQHPARQQVPMPQQQMPSHQQQTGQQMPQESMPQQSMPPQAGTNLDDVLARMQNGKPIDSGYIHSSGMASQLGSQIGVSPAQASDVLSQILSAMGGMTRH